MYPPTVQADPGAPRIGIAIAGSVVGGLAALGLGMAWHYRASLSRLALRNRGREPVPVSRTDTELELSELRRAMGAAVQHSGLGLDTVHTEDSFTTLRGGRFATGAHELVFGRPAQAALGISHYLLVPEGRLHRGLAEGTAAIAREVAALGTPAACECLEYVLHAEAGSSDLTYQDGLKRDCDEDGNVLECRTIRLAAEYTVVAEERARGSDTAAATTIQQSFRRRRGQIVNGVLPRRPSRRGMRLADFVNHPSARLARLTEAQVVALRLYTTAAFSAINDPMRDQDRYERGEPHPLPMTVANLGEALRKLRAVEADLHAGTAMQRLCLYRGMKNVTAPAEFMARGGTELAPMSTTSDLEVAMRYSASRRAVLLRLITESFYERGPDISFASAFPAEAEFLFPPLTYLQPTGHVEVVLIEGLQYEVVDVRPRI